MTKPLVTSVVSCFPQWTLQFISGHIQPKRLLPCLIYGMMDEFLAYNALNSILGWFMVWTAREVFNSVGGDSDPVYGVWRKSW